MRYFPPFLTKTGPLDSAGLSETIRHIAGMKTAPVRQPSAPAGASGLVAEDLVSSFWHFVGPINIANSAGQPGCFPTSGRINAVAFDPTNEDTWYAGSSNGGVWRTIDSGKTWKPIADSWPLLSVSSISVDKSGKNVYVGTGDCPGQGSLSMGVMKGDGAGSTWNNISDPGFKGSRISRVAVHPDSPDIVLAADFDGFLWRSQDAGKRWKTVNPSEAGGWTTVDFGAKDAGGKRTCYAMARNGKYVYVSGDGGASWNAYNSPLGSKTSDGRPQIAASPVTAGTVYLFSPDEQKIWRNTKSGDGSWEDITGNYTDGPEPTYCHCMACSFDQTSKNDVLYVGLYSVFQTVVGSGHWSKVEGDAPGHADMHALAVCPSDPSLLLIGNDGGVYSLRASFTPSPAVTVVPKNETLAVPQVYEAAYFFGFAVPALVGMQDTGTAVPGATADKWTFVQPLGGDGGGCAVNLFNTQFATADFPQQLAYTVDGWATSRTIVDNTHLMASDPNLPPNPPMVIDPYRWDQLYVATSYLYRWTCKTPALYGGSWENRLGGQLLEGTKNTVQAIAIGSSDGKSGNRIYTGALDGQVWMSNNAGTKWTKINGDLPAKISVSAVSVNPQNADDLLIVLYNNAPNGSLVWRCKDTTDPSPKWVDVGQAGSGDGLPTAFPLRTVARDLFDPVNCWYVGGDVGVFYTEDAGAHWYNAGHPLGLPNVPVYQLQVLDSFALLFAATYGRGIYSAQLAPAVKVASVTIDPSSVQGGTRASGTITMDANAPPLGVHVYLTSSDPAAVQVPPAVTIDSGKKSATFSVTTKSVKANVKCTIGVTYGGTSKSAEISVTVN